MSEEEILCSFCGRAKSQTKILIAGLDAHICDICISQADMIVKDDQTSKESSDFSVDLKPPIEIKKGPVIVCPPSKFAKNIFKHVGQVLEVRNEKLSYKFWSTASLMATYYEMLNTSSKWLSKKGINKKLADTYVAELFLALSQDALNKSSQGFKKLVADSQTPKGLNMQVLNELKKGKFFTKFSKALENVNKRVSK